MSSRVMGLGLNVRDLTAMTEYYTDVLGMTSLGKFDFETLSEIALVYGDAQKDAVLMLVSGIAEPPDVRQNWGRLILQFDDVREVVARVRAAGHEVTDVNEVPDHGTAVAHTTDPEGNSLELVQFLAR